MTCTNSSYPPVPRETLTEGQFHKCEDSKITNVKTSYTGTKIFTYIIGQQSWSKVEQDRGNATISYCPYYKSNNTYYTT